MDSRILALLCVISAGCGGGYLNGMPLPSIPELPAPGDSDLDAVVEISLQPPAVVATSTGMQHVQPGPTTEDDDIQFAESANPLDLRDVDLATKPPEERPEVPHYPTGNTWDPDPVYDSGAVQRKIVSTYMTRLQRCFRPIAEGHENPGKLRLEFTVGTDGRVTSADAEGLTEDMARCAEQRAVEWRFAAPYDDDGEPTEATLTISFHIS